MVKLEKKFEENVFCNFVAWGLVVIRFKRILPKALYFFCLYLKDRLIHVQDVVDGPYYLFPRNNVRLEQYCIFSYISRF
jgi:hypothetical protein